MTEYQIALLYSPALNEAELAKTNSQVETWIKEVGDIKKQNNLEKIKLAYPVKKQIEAFFVWFFFQAEAEKIIPLQNKLKEEGNILRFLLIKDKLEKTETKKKGSNKKGLKKEEASQEENEENETGEEIAVNKKAKEKEEKPKEKKIRKKAEQKEAVSIDEELEKVLNE